MFRIELIMKNKTFLRSYSIAIAVFFLIAPLIAQTSGTATADDDEKFINAVETRPDPI